MPSGSGSTAHRVPEAPAAGTDAATTDAAATGSAKTASDGRDGVLGAATAAAAGGAGVAGMTAAAIGAGTADARPRTDERAGEHQDPQYRDFEYTPGGADAERSPASQWLILVAQVLASAVAGAALFIGFQLLWNNLTWVALALAIVVIVGLVAMVRVLRRSSDTVSIALAVIVGLGVTCGPLLLRLVT